MSRERSYKSIILKKQPYGEGDEILTVYTEEAGKLRGLAKSSKAAKSKLSYSLQSLFLVNLNLAGAGLPKIIGAEVVEAFPKLRESFEALKISFYAVELVLKFTPDEEKNDALFSLLRNFLSFLNSSAENEQALQAGLAKFKIEFLESQGLGLNIGEDMPEKPGLGFSNYQGKFLFEQDAVDFKPVSGEAIKLFTTLQKTRFEQIQTGQAAFEAGLLDLQELLSGFLTFQLEREIKSERYLGL